LLLAWYFQFIHLGRGWQQLSDKITSLSLNRACYGTTLAHVSCPPSNESYTPYRTFHILLQLQNEDVNSLS
jgi:hypothetical protein